jgi:hypothetical protein
VRTERTDEACEPQESADSSLGRHGLKLTSLRWPIAGHMCANMFGLSVPVLLNIHVPYEG